MSTPIRPSGGDGDPGPSDRNRIKVDMVTIEELADMLENGTLLDHPEGFKVDQPTTLIKAFLLKNEPEFRRLMAFRVRVSSHSQLIATRLGGVGTDRSIRDGSITRPWETLSSNSSVRRPTTLMTKARSSSTP